MRLAVDILRRLVVLGWGLGAIATGVYVFGVIFRVVPVAGVAGGGLLLDLAPSTADLLLWALAASAAVMLGVALILAALVPGRRRDGEDRAALLDLPGLDEGNVRVRIRTAALVDLIDHHARRFGAVREVGSTVVLEDQGWRVRCKVALSRGTALKPISDQLTAELVNALEESTGVPVAGLDLDLRFASAEAGVR